MTIKNLIQQTRHRLAVLEVSEKRFARQLAPRFSLFEAFRFDELTLSRCLGNLLDPTGTHGQGTLFLESFLELINTSCSADDIKNATVQIEMSILDRRRIDLVIRCGGTLIGIENKPWAIDQDQQLEDYAAWLEKQPGKWKLIYLCNSAPSEGSLSEPRRRELYRDDFLKLVDFHQLEQWLVKVAAPAQALTVRVFIEQLAILIRKNMNGALDMTEQNEIEELIKGDADNLKAVIAISTAWPDIQIKLLEELKKQLTKLWQGSMLWDDRMGRMSAYCGFGLKRREGQDFVLSFQFDVPGLNGLYWGVSFHDGKIPSESKAKENAAEIHRIMEGRFGTGEGSEYYAWWDYAGGDSLPQVSRDWTSSTAPWLQIQNGTLAQAITKLADEVYSLFDNQPELLNRRTDYEN